MDKQIKIKGSLLARNTLLNFIGQVVPLLVGVTTIPFIVRGLGTERFGLLSLAWVVLGYFAIFDLGLGRATTKFVAEALGKGEQKEVPRLVWTAVTVQTILGTIGGLALVGITPLLVERLLNIPQNFIEEARATFYLLALSIPVVLISGSFRGVLEAVQRFDLINAVTVPATSLTYLLSLLGLALGFSLPGIVVLIVLARLGVLVTFVVLNLRLIPELKRFSGSFSLFPRLFSFGGWVMVSSIAAPTFTYLERFFIASFLSVGALTFYAVPYEMISRLVILPTSIAITLFPAFSYYSAGNYTEIKQLFSRSFKYLFFSMTIILVVFIVFADKILTLWLGEEFAQKSAIILQILTVVFFLHAFAYVPFTAIHGLGRPDLKAKLDLTMLPSYVGLCWWLIPRLDLVGAALAKLLITVIDVVYLLWMAKNLSGLSIREMFGEGAAKTVIIASIFALAAFSFTTLSHSFISDLVILGILTPVYLFLLGRSVMDEKDKMAFKSLLGYFSLGRGKT